MATSERAEEAEETRKGMEDYAVQINTNLKETIAYKDRALLVIQFK